MLEGLHPAKFLKSKQFLTAGEGSENRTRCSTADPSAQLAIAELNWTLDIRSHGDLNQRISPAIAM